MRVHPVDKSPNDRREPLYQLSENLSFLPIENNPIRAVLSPLQRSENPSLLPPDENPVHAIRGGRASQRYCRRTAYATDRPLCRTQGMTDSETTQRGYRLVTTISMPVFDRLKEPRVSCKERPCGFEPLSHIHNPFCIMVTQHQVCDTNNGV